MPGGRSFAGLDVGGTFLKGARVAETGEVDSRLHEPVARDAEALLDQVARAVVSLGGGTRLAGVGIGVPGIVERGGSRVRVSPNLPALNGVAVGEELSRRLGVPVFLENDANAAALAEAWLGAGRGAESLLCVTLGTGIGAGLVLQGRVWSGRSGYAGEIGHIQVEDGGFPCGCGSRGCLETVAGIPGWRRRAEAGLAARESSLRGKDLDPAVIVEHARAGDRLALEVVDGAARAIGIGIAAVLDLLNLDRVVLAGGVAAAGPFLLDRIVEETRQRTYPQVFADCGFRPAELSADAGVVGAARVAMTATA